MSEAKFTRGGWNFNQEIEVDDSMVIVDDNYNVITYLHSGCVFDGSGYFNKMNDEQEANANLIAAAPEMYEMLESLAKAIVHDKNYATAKPVFDLLAKARGESV
ncbi:putative coil containing protein [Vibrio phage 199E37-1]|nr:putative coil containing protein [Vibrio phage 199E37-1]